MLCGAVASLTIGFAAAEQTQREHGEGLAARQRDVAEELLADARLGTAHRRR